MKIIIAVMVAGQLLPPFLYACWNTYHPGFFKSVFTNPFLVFLPTFVPFAFSSSTDRYNCRCCCSCLNTPHTPKDDRTNIRFWWRSSLVSCIMHLIVPGGIAMMAPAVTMIAAAPVAATVALYFCKFCFIF